jgi:hypothetical protein
MSEYVYEVCSDLLVFSSEHILKQTMCTAMAKNNVVLIDDECYRYL